jgi:phosphoribosylformylglycinamidine (FGAM) synthase PurS component
VTIHSFLVKNVLQTYDRQLGTTRRLARMGEALRQAGVGDRVTLSQDAKRKQMVERVAREIMDNLLVAGSRNPVVQDIQNALEDEFGERFVFCSSSGGGLTILRQGGNGPQELSPDRLQSVLDRLWEITLHKVDETML